MTAWKAGDIYAFLAGYADHARSGLADRRQILKLAGAAGAVGVTCMPVAAVAAETRATRGAYSSASASTRRDRRRRGRVRRHRIPPAPRRSALTWRSGTQLQPDLGRLSPRLDALHDRRGQAQRREVRRVLGPTAAQQPAADLPDRGWPSGSPGSRSQTLRGLQPRSLATVLPVFLFPRAGPRRIGLAAPEDPQPGSRSDYRPRRLEATSTDRSTSLAEHAGAGQGLF